MNSSSLLRRLRAWLLRTPGSTVDVESWTALVRRVAEHDRAAGLDDPALPDRFAAVAGAAVAGDPAALAEALALSRATAERALGLRPYDEQLLGARALLDGRVVQMATGEGKTLVAALAAALAADRVSGTVLNARNDADEAAIVAEAGAYAAVRKPPSLPAAGPGGELDSPAARQLVAEAQRFAEIVDLEVHRNTWRYHHLLEQHRQTIQAKREAVLTGDSATRMLGDLMTHHGDDRVTEAARQIALHHIDAAWADYLDATGTIRENIHLRAFANLDPVDEFHRAVIPLFRELWPEIERRTADDFRKLDLSDPDGSLDQLGLDRPSATWTYVADDTAFQAGMDQFFTGVLRFVRGGWKAAKNRG